MGGLGGDTILNPSPNETVGLPRDTAPASPSISARSTLTWSKGYRIFILSKYCYISDIVEVDKKQERLTSRLAEGRVLTIVSSRTKVSSEKLLRWE